jgi:hypothetical protein
MSRDFRNLLAEFNARTVDLAKVSGIRCINAKATINNWITAFAIVTVGGFELAYGILSLTSRK